MNPNLPYAHQQTRSGLRRWSVSILLVMAALGLNISCGGGGGDGNSTIQKPPPATTASVVGTVKNQITQQGIAGASVTDGTVTTTTAADGTYTLKVIPSDRKQITIVASNYGYTQRIAKIFVGGTNRVDAVLLPSTILSIPDLTSGATISVPNSPAQVVLPANSLVTANGGTPVFPVMASLTPIDPTLNPALMPGDYTSSAGELIESFGALDVTFTDDSGAKLNLASGQVATIRIPLASAQWGGTPLDTVPAFYFDATSGRWAQEGTLTLGGAVGNQYYEGTVEHFSVWNADQAATTSYITGKVVRKDGTTPVGGATVTATGVDYTGTTIAISAADGSFTIPVKAGATITLIASMGYLGSPAPVMTFVTGTTGTMTIPGSTISGSIPFPGDIVVDGFLNLTGTLRDFSPSAPYQFPYASTTSLTTNGTFASDTGWTKGTGWTISGGVATCGTHTGTSDLKQNQATANPVTYTVTYTVSGYTAGTITAILGGTSGTARSANGTYVETIACGTGADPRLVLRANAAFRGSIDNVSVIDPHPPAVTIDANTPFPEYSGDPVLGPFDGPWWNPDFESSNDWLTHIAGIVKTDLGANNKPVFDTTKVWTASCRSGVHSTASFNAWWTDFPSPHGPKDAVPYQGPYTIPLSEVLPTTDPPTYTYENAVQFPIDGMYQNNYIYDNPGSTSGNRGTVPTAPEDSKSHNFHYTYELHTTFTYKQGAGQVFSFTGDDDVYVFINKKLVIDLGGVHGALSGSIALDGGKSVDGALLNLVDGMEYQFDFFYCERHTTQSHMKITTSIPFVPSPPN